MDICNEPLAYLQDTLCKELKVPFLNRGEKVKLNGLRVKRKPNQDGDVHIPAFARNMEEVTDNEVDLTSVSQEITSSHTLGKLIDSINLSNNGQLNVRLNRVSVTKAIICNVMSKGSRYGISPSNANNELYILNGCVNYDDNQELSSLASLRIVVTLGHVKNLLSANGKSTEIIPLVATKDKEGSPLEDLSLFNEIIASTEQESQYKLTLAEIQQTLQKSKYTQTCNISMSSSEAKSLTNSLTPNQCLCFDRQIYNEDCSFGQVSITTSLLTMLCSLESATRHSKDRLHHIFHVTNHRKLRTSQQHGLVWQELFQKSMPQSYLSVGDITALYHQHGHQLTVKDILRIRENQVRSAYLLKYGDIVHGPGWEESIQSVAVATVKLQIMTVSKNNHARIDVSEKSQDFRQATFIMYNCARLMKLFQHYEDSVEQGQYPHLPEIDKIDFSLLREMDEWKLLLCYVMQYPSVVRSAVHDLSDVQINVNRISCFLLDLCKDFSSYYGRTHVLREPRAHLFPLMFARLYLLKSIQQVLHNCLALLDICPLTQM